MPSYKASNIDNWNSLFEFMRMVNIVGLYMAMQTGLSNRWQAMVEDEFWLLGIEVWLEVFVQIFEKICWSIHTSNLWVMWLMQQTSHFHENL